MQDQSKAFTLRLMSGERLAGRPHAKSKQGFSFTLRVETQCLIRDKEKCILLVLHKNFILSTTKQIWVTEWTAFSSSSPVSFLCKKKLLRNRVITEEKSSRDDADVDDEGNERWWWSQTISSAAIPAILALHQSFRHRFTPFSDHYCKLIQQQHISIAWFFFLIG